MSITGSGYHVRGTDSDLSKSENYHLIDYLNLASNSFNMAKNDSKTSRSSKGLPRNLPRASPIVAATEGHGEQSQVYQNIVVSHHRFFR